MGNGSVVVSLWLLSIGEVEKAGYLAHSLQHCQKRNNTLGGSICSESESVFVLYEHVLCVLPLQFSSTVKQWQELQ